MKLVRTLGGAVPIDADAGGLCERGTEIHRIEVVLARVCAGEGGVVQVEGPRGVGRSALLDVVAQRAQALGSRVLSVRGSRGEERYDLACARRLLEPVPTGDAPSPWPDPIPEPADANGWYGVLRALHRRITDLAAHAPVLLVVDDCQWVDLASQRLIGFVARRLSGVPVGIVLASCDPAPEEAPLPLAELRVECDPTVVRLGLLSPDAVDVVVRRHLGPAVGPDVRKACATATGGNPLLLAELLRELADRVDGAQDAASVRAAAPVRIAWRIGLDLARYPASVEHLARALAMLGQARPSVAGAVAGIDQAAAVLAADTLVADGLVQWSGAQLRWAAPVVGRALDEHMPREWRARASQRMPAGEAEGRSGSGSGPVREADGRSGTGPVLAPVPSAVSDHDPRLTPSELRVARCAAVGRTNREVAAALFVSPKTVEMHLCSTYRKLGISSRNELRAALG